MRNSLLLLTFFCLLSAHAADKSLERIITADADLIVSVRDISELREALEEHPLIRDFGDASLLDLFGPAADDSNESSFEALLEEFELDAEELFELIPDQLGLALYNLPELLLQKADRPDLAVMAHFAGSAERLDELMQIQFERNAKAQREVNPAIDHEMVEERFMGETLYFDETFDGEKTYIEDGYALVDGIFILASPEERLRTIVESIKVGTDQPISRAGAYLRAREESGPADLGLFLNLESIMPTLNEALLKQVMAGGMAMFGVSGQSLEAALALESLQAFSLDCTIEADGIRSHSAMVYREKLGFLKMLPYEEGALPAASYVPEGVLSSTVAQFNLSEMFAELEALLGVASPSTPALINIQLQQVKNNSGVDFRSALLENFGSEIVSFSMLPEGLSRDDATTQTEDVYVFEIKDAAALSGALEALKDLIPGARAQIKTRDFQGETIHTFRGFSDPTQPDVTTSDFSFVVTRTHLILNAGRVGLIQGVLSSMQTQDSGFWQLEETQALIDRIGKDGAVSRSYTDLGQVITVLLESFAEAGQFSASGFSLDASKIPADLDLSWHLLTETHEASDGIFNHTVLMRKEGL